MMTLKIKTIYNRKDFPVQASPCPDPSLTDQTARDEANINRLVDRYNNTGTFYDPFSRKVSTPRMPFFADMTQIPTDPLELQNYMAKAQEAFMTLPPNLRRAFDNNPMALVAGLSDPAVRAKLVQIGVLDAERVSGANPTTAKPGSGNPVQMPAIDKNAEPGTVEPPPIAKTE
uniref:Internal scaffolding protein n=2 Tax=unclassified Microvirus TaxID=338099 RepID=A0AAU8B649_9VIRU